MIVEQRWIVGRNPSCDVRVDDEYASPRHCEVVRLASGRFVVRDLGSMNGTYITKTVRNLVGVQRILDVKVTDWTYIEPDETLKVGRSAIPWASKPPNKHRGDPTQQTARDQT